MRRQNAGSWSRRWSCSCATAFARRASATSRRRPGFTNPALFKHFHSKDDLARYLFERCYLELAGLVSRAIASGATFAEKQRAVIDAYLAALDRDANSVLYVQDLLRHFWPQMPDRVRRHSIVGDVRRLLASARAEGAIGADIDLDLLTTAWIGTLQQFARFRYFGQFKQSTRALADALDALRPGYT